jgi:hypothetical protein
MYIAFISNLPANLPFDEEPLLPTVNVGDRRQGSGQPALSWPAVCAEVARTFLAANSGGPPVLKPVGDDDPLPLPGRGD